MEARRGATVLDGEAVRFSVWAPRAEAVAVCVEGGTGQRRFALQPAGNGSFEGLCSGVGPGDLYRYELDGGPVLPDPASRSQPHGVHGPSQVVDTLGWPWTDGAWRGIDMADVVLYELHVGTFTREGTFEAAARRFDDLRELGVTAVELLPVGQFPGRRNWGYDGVFPYAPQDSYGGPSGLQHMVDAAHAAGLAVFLDVVYNHVGPEGNALHHFGPYFASCYATPWGQALNFDGADSDEVRRYVLDNALYWIEEYHIDGLRLDAVHAIFDFSARHILAEMAEEVQAAARRLHRRVHVVAESDLNDPRLVRERTRGGHGLSAQWSDDFHHAVHAWLTGERSGYYQDFQGLPDVAKVLQDRFVFDGTFSRFRRRRHGAPAGDVPRGRFIVCIQNHDQVGNRACGERLSVLLSFERSKLAAAVLLWSPYVPLLFMGEEYGEVNPFCYFVSHGDPALIEAVRQGRRREFGSFDWPGDIPDPAAEATFAASRITPQRAEHGRHQALRTLYRDALAVRRSVPAMRDPGTRLEIAWDPVEDWISWRFCTAETAADLAVVVNAAALARSVAVDGSGWQVRLSTNAACYGGDGEAVGVAPSGGTATSSVRVPAATAAVLQRIPSPVRAAVRGGPGAVAGS